MDDVFKVSETSLVDIADPRLDVNELNSDVVNEFELKSVVYTTDEQTIEKQ